jgi:hypothetical protein
LSFKIFDSRFSTPERSWLSYSAFWPAIRPGPDVSARYSVIYFLQGDDVRRRVGDDLGDAIRIDFCIHTDTEVNVIRHRPQAEPGFLGKRLQRKPFVGKKSIGSGTSPPDRPNMKFRVFFIADTDGADSHLDYPCIPRFIGAGGG